MGITESHLLAFPGDTLAKDDAEWMPGKSRTRLAPDLDNGFLMDAAVSATNGTYFLLTRFSIPTFVSCLDLMSLPYFFDLRFRRRGPGLERLP
jgi:hypothetical protein